VSTPLQFAKEQCANFEHDGSCKGIGIKDDGSLYSFGKKPACVLIDRKARCQYFEECVLPMGIDPCNARNVIRAQERQEALKLYSKNSPKLASGSGKLCPECRMRELDRGHRFCYVCAEKRRKASNIKSRSHVGKTASISNGISGT
jgi:hypothetical protein